MDFNQGCVSYRSMPFWCVGSPLSDPFGGAVLSRFDSLEIAKIIAWAAREGYVEATSYHDDDLVPWDPEHPEDDQKAVEELLDGGGKTIVCGGTTSNLVARVLDKPLIPTIEYFDPEIPPTAKIQGIDLVTEGVITIGHVLKLAKGYLENEDLSTAWAGKKDGASRIAQLLFEEATDIRFIVGRAINPAHQNPDLPISIVIKMGLIDELAEILRKMGKQVTVSYY